MANNCYFQMKIAGPEAAVQEFIRMLKWEGPYQSYGLGRVFSLDPVAPGEVERDPVTGNVAIEVAGDCGNSVLSAMRKGFNSSRNLEDESERLGVALEYYSSETGCEFQEHGIIVCGNIVEAESVHYEEYCVEGMSPAAIDALCREKELTQDQLMAAVNYNGDYCVGGYPNFGEFSDLFEHLEHFQVQQKGEGRKPPLEAAIQAAEQAKGPEPAGVSTPERDVRD